MLAKTAESMPEVRSIVLKERLMPDNSQHWFIIVDADSEDPVLFSKLSAEGSRLAGGRDMEFMFGSTELGKSCTIPCPSTPGKRPDPIREREDTDSRKEAAACRCLNK